MAERPAPLLLVVDPAGDPRPEPPFGSYAAVARAGRLLLAAELSRRLAALGAAIARLEPVRPEPDRGFHWGRWFTAAARRQLADTALDAIGYAGAGSVALLGEPALEELLSPVAGEAVTNNRFSTDAFVVAGDLERALAALEPCPTDNAAARHLEEAGFRIRDLASQPWSRFDVDTPLDLALLRLAAGLPGTRTLDGTLAGFLAMATLPGGRRLELRHLAALGEVVRSRDAQLVVAGRASGNAVTYLETESACRIRWFIEERGMRSAPDQRPHSLVGDWVRERGAADLVSELASLGDAVILDSRVVMASLAGSADAEAWPPEEERFASDFLDAERVATGWLVDLTAAAAAASVPVVLGGHTLVSDGLRLVVDAAWLGR